MARYGKYCYDSPIFPFLCPIKAVFRCGRSAKGDSVRATKRTRNTRVTGAEGSSALRVLLKMLVTVPEAKERNLIQLPSGPTIPGMVRPASNLSLDLLNGPAACP